MSLDDIEERFLHWLKPPGYMRTHPYTPPGGKSRSMLAQHFGTPLWAAAHGRVVLDYGCGDGPDTMELLQRGAARVIGLDIHDGALARARQRAAAAGFADRCTFARTTEERVDLIVSSDTFEHVADLGGTLAHMHRLLKPGGRVWASFGPPWYHPKGGHVFAVFPWAHLLLSEPALCRWRATFHHGPITHFREAGLNQMTLRRFEAIVAASPFAFEASSLIPIQRIRRLGLERWRWIREFATSVVTCRLRRR